jgi:hypothetical protein
MTFKVTKDCRVDKVRGEIEIRLCVHIGDKQYAAVQLISSDLAPIATYIEYEMRRQIMRLIEEDLFAGDGVVQP